MEEHKPVFCRNPDLHVESARHLISCILFTALQPMDFRQCGDHQGIRLWQPRRENAEATAVVEMSMTKAW